MIWLSVALGGAVGACLRYALFLSMGTVGGIPVGTFIANALGATAMGVLAAAFRNADAWGSPVRMFLLVGVLGLQRRFPLSRSKPLMRFVPEKR